VDLSWARGGSAHGRRRSDALRGRKVQRSDAVADALALEIDPPSRAAHVYLSVATTGEIVTKHALGTLTEAARLLSR